MFQFTTTYTIKFYQLICYKIKLLNYHLTIDNIYMSKNHTFYGVYLSVE